MTIVVVISALVVVALSGAFAVGLGRAAARGDELLGDELAILRARAGERVAAMQARPRRS